MANARMDHQTEHENIISDAQVLVFARQHYAETVNIFDHTAVQVITISHHLFLMAQS